MKNKNKIGAKGRVVLHEFKKGKLRSSSGKEVTNLNQALAIAFSEQEQAKKHGYGKRTWRGRTRMRPKKKKKNINEIMASR